MLDNEKAEQIKHSLEQVLHDLKRKRQDSSERTPYVANGHVIGSFANIKDISDVIRLIEKILSIAVDSIEFIKNILKMENIFKESSTLKSYNLPNFKENIPEKSLIHAMIDIKIDKLENKVKSLHSRGHHNAALKVDSIVKELRELNKEFFIDNNIKYSAYRDKSLYILNNETSELDIHRGYKKIIANLIVLISTLGTAHIINKVTTGNLLFFKKTDSSYKRDDLINTIKKFDNQLQKNENRTSEKQIDRYIDAITKQLNGNDEPEHTQETTDKPKLEDRVYTTLHLKPFSS